MPNHRHKEERFMVVGEVTLPMDTTPEATEVQSSTEQLAHTTQTTVEQSQVESEPFLKIKYNKEELALDRDRAIELAQKGANYDKVYEKLQSFESDPRLSFVEKQAQKYGMGIDEYLQAVEEAERQEEINRLVEENIPESIAKELYENRKFREQMSAKEQEFAVQEQRTKDYQQFLQQFPDVNPENISPDVWQMVNQGMSLTDAYVRWDYNNLRTKAHTQQVNSELADKSTGPITGNGNPTSGFFTREQVKAMSQDDVMKNYDSIMESMKTWK